jgi:hypothetical protein
MPIFFVDGESYMNLSDLIAKLDGRLNQPTELTLAMSRHYLMERIPSALPIVFFPAPTKTNSAARSDPA